MVSSEKTYSGVTNDVLESIVEDLKKKFTLDITPVESPTAIILGGQPGAGKGTIHAVAQKRFKQNVIVINSDDYREQHPDLSELIKDKENYGKNTNEFAFKIADRLVKDLSAQGYNLVIEKTLGDPITAYKNNKLLLKRGYTVELAFISTPKDQSWRGVVERYERALREGTPARFVPKDYHDKIVGTLVSSIDELYRSKDFSNIRIYDRKGQCLYDMSVTPQINPAPILGNVLEQTQELVAQRTARIQDAEKKFTPMVEVTSSEHPEIKKGSYTLYEFDQLTKRLGKIQGQTYNITYTLDNIMVSENDVGKLRFDQEIGNGSPSFPQHVESFIQKKLGTDYVLDGKPSKQYEIMNNCYQWTVPHLYDRISRERLALEMDEHTTAAKGADDSSGKPNRRTTIIR